MVVPFLKSGDPHSGSYLFVRSKTQVSDAPLLEMLGLNEYHPTKALFDLQRWVVIGNSETWTVVGDDFDREKFHSPSAPEVLDRLITSSEEVFFCVLPDVDEGSEFFYWRNGTLLRSYQKCSKDWGTTYTIDEFGTALAAETGPTNGTDRPTDRVWAIARSLGFDLAESSGSYRVFAGPQHKRLGLDGPFITNIPREIWENPILGPRLIWREE